FSGAQKQEDSLSESLELFRKAGSDFVVLNHIKDRNKNIQNNFLIIDKEQKTISASTAEELSQQLTKIILQGL
ncbi:MAG: hypothetical protein ACK4UV_11620, partial [Ignavibacterium sp.]